MKNRSWERITERIDEETWSMFFYVPGYLDVFW